ncbi:hypothetical protein SOCE26_075140 [Sorangium cellulosum]|uniref:Phosphodiester glycosidase domain-containing protein n=1 Tax=Sorangium cellulosum TaxID=56 RepID=A0A2L0F3D2_SORCE|nr:hypothetical protein [Sorangium cellulosum]AUX46011.1 hypothetical protein SOCE26_075140 [Sorangium cellulosum]
MTERPPSSRVDHLRGRLPVALGVAALGLVARLATPPPPARTADAIAGMLGQAIGGAVSPDDFVWEERGGFLHDALIGRRVLFVGVPGAPDAGREAEAERGTGASEAERTPDGRGAADLYRARVRLTRSGRPVSLSGVRNLTETPLGDDRHLVARGRRVAVTTSASGAVQGIALLDLGGDVDRQARPAGERLRAAIAGWLEAGAAGGVSRIEISFERPPASARLDLADEALVMALGPEALPAALNASTGELDTGGNDPFGARAHHVPRRVPSFLELAGSSAGRLLGPDAAAAVERIALAARSVASAALRAAPEDVPAGPGVPVPAEPVPPGLPSLWPPPPVAPAVSPPLPGEGVWSLVPSPAARPLPGAGGDTPQPPAGAFAATFVRPDPEHPRRRVHLLAIDTRRVAFDLQAGFDAPRPAIGPRGTGRLPERALPVIVGAIGLGARAGGLSPSGGAAGALGVVVEGRALVPPVEGAASLAVDRNGRPLFGAWPSGAEAQRPVWALWQGPGLLPGGDDDLLVERAALCMTERGFVIHAWGKALDAATLTAALRRAGCAAGLSLGRAPSPLGFAFVSPREGGGLGAERLLPAMSLEPERLLSASPDAFLYLVARGSDPAPSLPGGLSWSVDRAAQPYPTWLPAVHSVDVVHLGAQVRVVSFAPDRFLFRLRAGSREISPRSAPVLATALPDGEAERVLAAIGVGVGRRRGPRGLAVAGTIGLRFRGEGGLLLVRDGRLEIRAAGRVDLTPDTDATELPLTADDGRLRPEAREIGTMRRRGAACVLDDGTLLTATTTFDSDEATTEALLDLGCARVVALDRGAHRNAFVHRASGDPGLQPTYEETSLYAVGVAMSGRARRLAP